ncbi:MAG: FMN-binding protein [Candidatus Omnitrophica bacterium]|nr:FMN-binding protein [Candidatus Omnitrophota bacterium]
MKNKLTDIFANSVVRMIVALAIVGTVSGAALVLVYNYSMPKIKVNMKADTERAIKDIFPQTDKIQNTKEEGVFKAVDSSGKLLGYAFLAEGNGYQGTIKMIAGVDGSITTMNGMEVLESQETPGLGAEIADDKFRKQFNGLSLSHEIEYVKNEKPQQPYEIEAITGATISSRSVVHILNKRIGEIRKALKG